MRFRWLCLGVIPVLLSACGAPEAEEAPQEVPIRAIKYTRVGGLAHEASRTLAGVVQAGTTSNVAFEVSGQVQAILVKVGDDVKEKQLLARLDAVPYELLVKESDFSLKKARATLADAEAKYSEQQQLFDQKYSTKTALDSAQSDLGNARGQVGIAQSRLAQARRDLSNTKLRAPFAGRISERLVEVFEEIPSGTPILKLQTEGEIEVSVSLPEQLVGSVSVGQKATVSFPALANAKSEGTVTELSPQAKDANAFPATLRLETEPEGLRSGMSAQVTFSFETDVTGQALAIPVSALKGEADTGGQGMVFVYDPDQEAVFTRAVRVVGVDGNMPLVLGEIKAGDIIATAGVGYMYDGMKVRLMDQGDDATR